MKFENTEVWGFKHAVRGMRNPLESWGKSDSVFHSANSRAELVSCCELGAKDLELMRKLAKAGACQRKFMRQIFVSVDITAPLYWWKEFDTYKVGTVSDSCSTMHKLASTPITKDCFEMDDFDCCSSSSLGYLNNNPCVDLSMYWYHTTRYMERLRQVYNETKDKRYWKELVRLLPESWLQKRTVTMSYENVLNMYYWRCVRPHKLAEWSVSFKAWAESLPYARELFIEPWKRQSHRRA